MTMYHWFTLCVITLCIDSFVNVKCQELACDIRAYRVIVNGTCEELLQKGPCDDGEWLVLDENYVPRCKHNPCPRKVMVNTVLKNRVGKCDLYGLCRYESYENVTHYEERVLWNDTCILVADNPCDFGMEVEILPSGQAECTCVENFVYFRHNGTNQEGCFNPYYQGPCSTLQYLQPIIINNTVVRAECRANKCNNGSLEVQLLPNDTITITSPGTCVPLNADSDFCNGVNGARLPREILKVSFLDMSLVCTSEIHVAGVEGPSTVRRNKLFKRKVMGCIYGDLPGGHCRNSALFLIAG